MAKERTKTGFELFPEGQYDFTVSKKPEKRRMESGRTYRLWEFTTIVDGASIKYTTVMFPNTSRLLLMALGGVEERPGEIEWDDEP